MLRGMTTIALDRSAARHAAPQRYAGLAATLLLIVGATLAGQLIARQWGSEPVALLYILPVLVAAVTNGLWPSLAAAVASTLAYNFYFTRPYHSFTIDRPTDVVTVSVLFLVALVVSRLAASLRAQSERADAHAARNATIAGFARRLLACPDDTAIASVAVAELARLFGAHVVLVGAAAPDRPLAVSTGALALAPNDFAIASQTLATGRPAGRGISGPGLSDWQFHPVIADHGAIATIGLARDDGQSPVPEDQRPLLDNLLDQMALALERARLEGEARDVAALRERDRLRSALLTSIGEDVKPRLNAISEAARSLRRAGGEDKALATSIAAEAAQLDRYVDGLIDLSPGEEQEPLLFGALAIDLHRRIVTSGGVPVHLTPKEYALLAELAKHAGRVLTHRHLLRAVWGPAQEQQIDYLRVAIRALRQKLEANPDEPALIVNEPAVGYRLVLPD